MWPVIGYCCQYPHLIGQYTSGSTLVNSIDDLIASCINREKNKLYLEIECIYEASTALNIQVSGVALNIHEDKFISDRSVL